MQLNWKIFISTSVNLQKAAWNIAKGNDLSRDLFHEMLLSVYSKNEVEMQKNYDEGKLEFYCIRVMMNMYSSVHSEFYKKYRHINDECIDFVKLDLLRLGHYEVQDTDTCRIVGIYDDVQNEVKVMSDYRETLRPIERILHEMYHKMPKKSYRKLGKQVGIPYRSVGLHIKNANNKIKNHLLCTK